MLATYELWFTVLILSFFLRSRAFPLFPYRKYKRCQFVETLKAQQGLFPFKPQELKNGGISIHCVYILTKLSTLYSTYSKFQAIHVVKLSYPSNTVPKNKISATSTGTRGLTNIWESTEYSTDTHTLINVESSSNFKQDSILSLNSKNGSCVHLPPTPFVHWLFDVVFINWRLYRLQEQWRILKSLKSW
jgi:hypothetical protein